MEPGYCCSSNNQKPAPIQHGHRERTAKAAIHWQAIDLHSVTDFIARLVWLAQTDDIHCHPIVYCCFSEAADSGIEGIPVKGNGGNTNRWYHSKPFQETVRLVRIHSLVCFLLLLSTRKTQSFQSIKPGACSSAIYTVRGAR